MKIRPALLTLLIATLWPTTALTQRPTGPLGFRSLEEGIDVYDGSVVVDRTEVEALLVRVDTTLHRLSIAADEALRSGSSVSVFLARRNARAVLSGGFLKSLYPPIPQGLVKLRGQILNRPDPDNELLDGALVINAGVPRILSFPLLEPEQWEEILQSGPLLVHGGRASLPEDSEALSESTRYYIGAAFNQAFVGIDARGRVILGATEEATLSGLARFLRRSPAGGGLGCDAALGLSGNKARALLVRAGGEELAKGPTSFRFANSIVVGGSPPG